jgi:hypothetical protein
MIVLKTTGKLKKTEKFLSKMSRFDIRRILNKYGEEGVNALAENTPVRSGETASSWRYKVSINNGIATVTWSNTHVEKGVNIAIILQYGHGTRNGGYVQGIDYINPALKPVFNALAEEAWMEVTSA